MDPAIRAELVAALLEIDKLVVERAVLDGDTSKLASILRSDRILSQHDRECIAAYLEAEVKHRRRRGRPPLQLDNPQTPAERQRVRINAAAEETKEAKSILKEMGISYRGKEGQERLIAFILKRHPGVTADQLRLAIKDGNKSRKK